MSNTIVHCTEGLTVDQTERFLANLRRDYSAFYEANSLPVPDFTEDEHYYMPPGFREWQNGTPRIPNGSKRLTWRSKEGNLIVVTASGYACNSYDAAYARLPEIIARLAEYEDREESGE